MAHALITDFETIVASAAQVGALADAANPTGAELQALGKPGNIIDVNPTTPGTAGGDQYRLSGDTTTATKLSGASLTTAEQITNFNTELGGDAWQGAARQSFRGVFGTLALLQAAEPAGLPGDTAEVAGNVARWNTATNQWEVDTAVTPNRGDHVFQANTLPVVGSGTGTRVGSAFEAGDYFTATNTATVTIPGIISTRGDNDVHPGDRFQYYPSSTADPTDATQWFVLTEADVSNADSTKYGVDLSVTGLPTGGYTVALPIARAELDPTVVPLDAEFVLSVKSISAGSAQVLHRGDGAGNRLLLIVTASGTGSDLAVSIRDHTLNIVGGGVVVGAGDPVADYSVRLIFAGDQLTVTANGVSQSFTIAPAAVATYTTPVTVHGASNAAFGWSQFEYVNAGDGVGNPKVTTAVTNGGQVHAFPPNGYIFDSITSSTAGVPYTLANDGTEIVWSNIDQPVTAVAAVVTGGLKLSTTAGNAASFDSSGLFVAPAGSSGLSTVTHNATLLDDGTVANPLKVNLANVNQWTGSQHYQPVALTPGATVTYAPSSGSGERTLFGMSQNTALAINDAGSLDGMSRGIDGSQDATGGFTLSAGANLTDNENRLANIPTAANAVWRVTIKRINGTWHVLSAGPV